MFPARSFVFLNVHTEEKPFVSFSVESVEYLIIKLKTMRRWPHRLWLIGKFNGGIVQK